MVIYLIVCGLTIWGIEHYRSIASQQRENLKAPDPGGGVPQARRRRTSAPAEKQIVDSFTPVLHQVLHDQPQIWTRIDQRMRALSATDDLIAKVDGSGLRYQGSAALSELGPYGHVRFNPERKSAVFFPRQIGREPWR